MASRSGSKRSHSSAERSREAVDPLHSSSGKRRRYSPPADSEPSRRGQSGNSSFSTGETANGSAVPRRPLLHEVLEKSFSFQDHPGSASLHPPTSTNHLEPEQDAFLQELSS